MTTPTSVPVPDRPITGGSIIALGCIREASMALLEERDGIARELEKCGDPLERLELLLQARTVSRSLKRLVVAYQILEGKEKP